MFWFSEENLGEQAGIALGDAIEKLFEDKVVAQKLKEAHRSIVPLLNQSAIFVGVVVSVLNVFSYTPPAPPPSRLNIIFDLEAV